MSPEEKEKIDTGGDDVKMEAEIGVMYPLAKENQALLAATGS